MLKDYQFQSLKQLGLFHAVIERSGGVSSGPFWSLNLGENTADHPRNVQQNLKRVQQHYGLSKIARLEQVHGTTILQVDSGGLFQGDALVTTEKNLTLMVRHADCQAAICYDSTKKVLALIHAGWKGQAQFFYTQVTRFLQKEFHCHPKDLYVAISPSLGPAHTELKHYLEELPSSLHRYHIGDDHFDLWQMALDEWVHCGVPLDQIEIARVCTYDHPDRFYSYRREKETGRNATIASMNESGRAP